MSLIGEALKKAHMEALRQESSTGRLYRLPGGVDMPERGSRRAMLVMIVASNLIIVSAIVIAAWAFSRTSQSKDSAIAVSSIAVEAPRPQTVAAPPVVAPAPVTAVDKPVPHQAERIPAPERPALAPPDEAKPAIARAAAPEGDEPVAEPRPLPRLSRKAPATAIALPAEDDGVRARSDKPRRGLVNGRTYARMARTSDGYELTLYGLSIAGDRGVALLNGRVLSEGDRIGDFTVGAIERGRVEIRDGEFRIYLTMR
ncbi:MAG: hypothetical protein ACYC7A_00225 [Thermoanaerobaculia bacterium]